MKDKQPWKEVGLIDSGIFFVDGDRSSLRYPSREEFVDSGVMFLNAESIKSGRINLKAVNHIANEKYDQIKKGRIQKEDILLTTRGNGIGDCAFVDIEEKGIINAQMLILRNKNNIICPQFLYYYITLDSTKNLINVSSGLKLN
ncbi:MAG: restriction endonuclease subunit S [Leptospiraceae bacterium]|nr:restriction endonuclease subunit S [Leptospiraceae bacterium]MCP5494646.1 restriction endonuclease subunit S [Leptospiraceae bacterium]